MAEASISGWESSLMAAEKVKERLRRATQALDNAGVPYAVAGGNAVAEWVGRVDEDAVRNTRDVHILPRRADLSAAQAALRPPASIITARFPLISSPMARMAKRAAACTCCLRVRRSASPTSTTCLKWMNPNAEPIFKSAP